MTAVLVTLVLDRYDGSQNPLVSGGGTFTPSQEFPAPADQMLIGQAPVPFAFRAGSLPQVEIIANDTAGPQQEDGSPGWTWDVEYTSGTPGSPASASYYVLSSNGATQYLSDLAAVPAAQPGQQYVPWPDTPPEADQVLGWDGSETEWVDSGGGGGGSGTVTSVAVESANGFAGTVADGTTTPQITLKTTVTGLLKGNGTAMSAAGAGTDYLTPTGSGAALTGITAAQVGADASGAAAAVQANLTAEVSRAEAAEALLAPLASPALTGSPTAPTQTTGDSSTKVATDAFVATAVATETTRAETAEALLAPKASPTLTGTPAAPTASALANSTQLATTAYADSAVAVETTRAEAAEGTLTTAVAGKVAKSGDTMTGRLSPTVTTVAFASTVTLPVTTNVLSLTLTGDCTVNAPSSGNDGDLLRVRIIGADTYTVTWGTGWNWGAAGAPTPAGPRDRIVAEYVESATVWDASADLGH